MAKANDEKREYALLLFLRGYTQKEIAKKVGVTEKTIGTWKEKHNWEKNKAASFLSNKEQIIFFYDQINEINTFIRERDEGKRFATSKEADALLKLTKAVKALEGDLGLSEIIDVGQEFLTFLKPLDFEASQILMKYYDQFIQSKMP